MDTAAVPETLAVQPEELSDDEFIDGNEESVKKKMKMFTGGLKEHSEIIHDSEITNLERSMIICQTEKVLDAQKFYEEKTRLAILVIF